LYYRDYSSLTSIEQLVKSQNNKIIYDIKIDSAMVSRIGRDLYFGTWNKGQDTQPLKSQMESMFPEYRCHIVDTGGHLDGTFCPVVPGLIVSSKEISREEFNKLFPGWEVVYTTKSIDNVNFLKLKEKNAGKWWVPGEEDNDDLIQFVQTYIDHWVGLIEETIIDVNMLVIDEKNVLCIKEDPEVFSAFERYGVTPHLTPFRHYNFWDGGLHCITADLHRDGDIKDFFPGRA
jgi:N-dimethylarginine dimethylaminohydrolase